MERHKIFEPPFDFQEYIEKRLQGIADLDEKKAAKAVLANCLMSGISQTEAYYQRLEDRVDSEVENDIDKYGVAITLVKREDYDNTSASLYPMLESDAGERRVDLEELADCMQAGRPHPLFPVLIESSMRQCREIEKGVALSGRLQTDAREYRIQIALKKDLRYWERIEHLYRMFLDNSVPWTTVNCGWLNKLFMIHILSLDAALGPKEKFVSLHIEFGSQYAVREDMIPLWNIEKILYSSTDFPLPCINGVNYEHEFPLKKYGLDDGYLIECTQEILEIRREKERLFLITTEELFDKWVAYRLASDLGKLPLSYRAPVLTNFKKDSFIKRYAEHRNVRLQTKAEIIRRVREFDTGQFVRFVSVDLVRETPKRAAVGEMNWFIQDELLDRDGQKTLLLRFKAEIISCLTEDVMNFLVSELQLYFEEYRCMGIIVEDNG